jgi:hypothetical protein
MPRESECLATSVAVGARPAARRSDASDVGRGRCAQSIGDSDRHVGQTGCRLVSRTIARPSPIGGFQALLDPASIVVLAMRRLRWCD